MTTYAISDTSKSFIHMAQTIGIAVSGPKDTGIKETLIVGNMSIKDSKNQLAPDVSHLSVYGNARITGKIRCGGVLMEDDDALLNYVDVVSLPAIYGNGSVFNANFNTFHNQTVITFIQNGVDGQGFSNVNKHTGVAIDSVSKLPIYLAGDTSTTTTDLQTVNSNPSNFFQVFTQRIDIATQGRIFSNGGYIMPSDKRIKEDIKTYDQLVALKQLNDLRVTTYKKIDDPFKKIEVGFISQEVKEIIPESITKIKMHIPDIYKWVPCTYDDETKSVTIDNTFELTFMYRLQVMDENFKKYSAVVTDVEDGKAVIHSAEFESKNDEEKPAISNRIFLYGKHVNDFLTLDKDVIFSVAVASIQALSKQVTDLTSRLEALETKKDEPLKKQRAKRVVKQK